MNDYVVYGYSVKEKKGRKLRVAKMIIYYVLLAAVYFIGISLLFSTETGFDVLFYPFLIALPLIMALVIWLSWRFTSLEYDFEFEVDNLTVSYVFGRKTRFVKQRISVDSFMEIAPFDDMTEAHLDELGCDKTFFYTADPNSPELCYAIFRIKDNRLAVMYFDIDSKMARILRRANPGATKFIKSFCKEDENEKAT